MEQGPDGQQITRFNDYVTSTWVDFNATFPRALWNQDENTGPRSNNHLEGFHNSLKKRMPRAHPVIFQFVKELKKIETADRRSRRQIGLGGAMRPRARVDRDRDARIERLKQQLATGRRSGIQFLDAVGHFIKLQNPPKVTPDLAVCVNAHHQ
ncbi:uncharacterized protein [Haliotis cracherodii]|uniref:uncharacterized protein n=1 Tax=Haliotis cracherodii TaxID=6455 RepID=UPI0039EAE161